jgi:hypothetical protein
MEHHQMSLFELVIFLLVCLGLGFLGHLVSPHYGWLLGAGLAVAVFMLMLITGFRRSWKNRSR